MLRIAFQLNEGRMRKLLTFLIALASIAFGVCAPASAQSGQPMKKNLALQRRRRTPSPQAQALLSQTAWFLSMLRGRSATQTVRVIRAPKCASPEGERFKMARSESVVTSSKSETRPHTAVRRLWRKIHSPAPIESD